MLGKIDPNLLIKIGLGAGAALGVLFLVKKATGAVGSAASAVYDGAVTTVSTTLNPASDQNLVYKSVNAVGGAVAGDSNFSLGSWLYDATHSDPLPPKPTASAPEQMTAGM